MLIIPAIETNTGDTLMIRLTAEHAELERLEERFGFDALEDSDRKRLRDLRADHNEAESVAARQAVNRGRCL